MKLSPVFRTISEQIAQQLRDDVLSGRLAEGEHLHEVTLAERFGVSRGPVRDALLHLTKEGILVYKPNCGVEVSPAPSEHVRPLVVDIRRQIETFALDIAFDRATPEDLRQWETILERLRAACQRNDLPGAVEADMAFHRWIIERSGEPALLAMWLPVVCRMRLGYSRHRDLYEVYPEHLKIFAAFQKGNRKAAAEALEANIV
jgi:DNA-binding GntR family transcriptional regulator